jgi:hypothetical protein
MRHDNGVWWALGAAAAAAGLAALGRRGSRRASSVLADVSGYPNFDAVPPELPVIRLPNGHVITAEMPLDIYDFEEVSEPRWLLFANHGGAEAQRRLLLAGAWLDAMQLPIEVWRGFNVPVGTQIRRTGHDAGDLHWSTRRDVAIDFAHGSDSGGWRPPLEPGMEAVLLRSYIQELSEVDWITSLYWFLASVDGNESELYVTPAAAQRLMREAVIVTAP